MEEFIVRCSINGSDDFNVTIAADEYVVSESNNGFIANFLRYTGEVDARWGNKQKEFVATFIPGTWRYITKVTNTTESMHND